MKQLILRIPNNVHTAIKIEASKQGISIVELFTNTFLEAKIITEQQVSSES